MKGIVEYINYNKPQLRLLVYILTTIKSATSIWGRGTGKSFAIALLMHAIVTLMPRSKWAIIGATYMQIRTRTIPSTKASLAMLGYEEGTHYLIGRKPQLSWKWNRPIEDPIDYEHVIVFPNGTIFQLVSLNGGTSGRGMNVDGIISDETLEQDKEKLDQQIKATNRGNLKRFSHVRFHHGTFNFTSMPYGHSWLIDEGSHMYENKELNLSAIKLELVQNQLKFFSSEDIEERLELWRIIRELKSRIKWLPTIIRKGRPHLKFYSEADPFDNIENVGIEYLEELFNGPMSDLAFSVEVLNYYPDKIEHGFYPWLDDAKHGYRGADNNDYIGLLNDDDEALKKRDSRMDADCLKDQPLRVAVDWGGKINCLTVTQYYQSINTMRFINEMYVKHPRILDDLATELCDYYRYHKEKRVIFLYDHTGNTSQANSKLTYSEQFAQILKKHGWSVEFAARKSGVSHMSKHLLWGKLLNRDAASNLPKVEFNLERCKYTLMSMRNAPIKETNGGFEKNKTSERNAFIPQEEATHLSDTADLHIVSLFSSLLDTSTFIPSEPVTSA